MWLYQVLQKVAKEHNGTWEDIRKYSFSDHVMCLSLPGEGMILMDEKPNVFRLEWFTKSFQRDRKSGPAQITYDLRGQIIAEKYYVNGKLHRPKDDGPAWRTKNKNRVIEIFYEHGVMVR